MRLIAFILLLTVAVASPAVARGHFRDGMNRADGAMGAGHRRGNSGPLKAAAAERDRLLKSFKDICKGC